MKIQAFSLGLFFCIVAFISSGCPPCKQFDPLGFYSQLTSIMAVYESRLGQATVLPGNQIQCSPFILEASDPVSYYGLDTGAIDGYYDTYKAGSQYDQDIHRFTAVLASLMQLFSDSGFTSLIVKQGRTPALMFDIDNTIAFTSNRDDDERGYAPPITALADFVRTYCFVDNVDCYFVTARSCNEVEALSTKKWLTDTLNLSEAQIERNVVLMGSVSGCPRQDSNVKIAYKDVIRKAISQRDNVYWLMSVGDQLTDSFGGCSGMKTWVPNLLFQANVVPNQYASNPNPGTKESCSIKTVVAPDDACMAQLIGSGTDPEVLKKTTVSYCSGCKDSAGCF